MGQKVPADWAHILQGLGPGDSFRLMFVTTTTTSAESADILHYDRKAIDAAIRNGHQKTDAGVSFAPEYRALVSTATVDARENTATTGRGVPIYWMNGNKVADDYAFLGLVEKVGLIAGFGYNAGTDHCPRGC